MRPSLLARGFVSQRADLYPFERWHPRWFLTDWDIEIRLPRVNPPIAASILANKNLFHLFNLVEGNHESRQVRTARIGVIPCICQRGIGWGERTRSGKKRQPDV